MLKKQKAHLALDRHLIKWEAEAEGLRRFDVFAEVGVVLQEGDWVRVKKFERWEGFTFLNQPARVTKNNVDMVFVEWTFGWDGWYYRNEVEKVPHPLILLAESAE